MKAIDEIGGHLSIAELEAEHREADRAIALLNVRKAHIHGLWEEKQLAKQHQDAAQAPAHLNQGIGLGGARLG